MMGNRQIKRERFQTVESEDETTDPSVEVEVKIGDTLPENSREYISSDEETEKDSERESPCYQTPLELVIRLRPTSDAQKSREKITAFPFYPRTGLEAKHHIEKEFQIPVCLQKLSFQSQVIPNNQPILSYYLKDGDSLTVEYTTQADLREVSEVLELMKIIIKFLESSLDDFNGPLSVDIDRIIQTLVKPLAVECLVTKYFMPVGTDRATANQLYFVNNDGVEMSIKLHELLSSIPWTSLSIEMQYMEHSILRVLWDLSSTIGIRCLLLQYPNLIEQLSRSILRQPIYPYQKVQASRQQHAASHATVMSQDFILGETMLKGMGVLTNLAELPSCRLPIAMQPKMIEQMTSAMLSPSYSVICAQIVISTFLCLSYSPETHKYLTSPPILHGVVAVCKKFSAEYSAPSLSQRRVQAVDITVIKYFTTLFFSLISTASTECITSEGFGHFFADILSFMHKFLHDYTYKQVRDAELETTYFWSTFKPFVKLVYFNYEKHVNGQLVKEKPLVQDLYLTSVKAGIFSLQNMCLSDETEDILEKEELTDFLICLPWYAPDDLKDDARLMVEIMSEKVKSHPPTLMNIVKARLASWCMPLEEVMSPSFVDKIHERLYEF